MHAKLINFPMVFLNKHYIKVRALTWDEIMGLVAFSRTSREWFGSLYKYVPYRMPYRIGLILLNALQIYEHEMGYGNLCFGATIQQ